MLSAVKVRLDPTPRQERALSAHVGAARFAYNCLLAHVKDCMDTGQACDWSMYGLRKWWNAHKQTLAVNRDTGLPWWQECSKETYSYAAQCLAYGLKRWKTSRTGKRYRVGFPCFKSKRMSRQAFAYTTGSFGLVQGKPNGLKLPKIGVVHCFENVTQRVGDAQVKRMTISYHAGYWYASLTIETPDTLRKPMRHDNIVGIDLGVSRFATLSTGERIANPKPLSKSLRKLARAQRALSRKHQGSHRYERAKQHVSRVYSRISNTRQDMAHKLSTRLAKTYAVIGIEDLNVQGMMKNHHLARAISDVSFYQFRLMLQYKCERENTQLIVVDRFYPSSKTCSQCGNVKAKLPLSERVYSCQHCGLTLDRDINAAINLAESASERINAHGETRRLDLALLEQACFREVRTKP